MKYIGVFCSANNLDQEYVEPAREFATLLAKNGYGLVWGGSNKGLMEVVATAVQDSGGRLVGVSMELLRDNARKNADEMIFAKDLSKRKAMMLKRSDAIVVLVGGLGTLDEITEIIELKKHKLHSKPVLILNTENFYSGLKSQLQKMKDDGFITQELDDLIHFADNPEEVIDFINKNLVKLYGAF